MGRKGSRYTLKEKLFYIGLVAGGMTAGAVQKKYGIDHAQITQWVDRYEAEGEAGLKPRDSHTRYTEEFKLEVIKAFLERKASSPALARQYGIPNHGVIYQWVSLYTSGKSLATTNRRGTPVKDGRDTSQAERIEIAEWTIAKIKITLKPPNASRSLMVRFIRGSRNMYRADQTRCLIAVVKTRKTTDS